MKMHMHPRLAIARARRDGLAEVQTLGRPLNRLGRRAYILLAVLRWRMRSRSTPCLHLALCATPLILRTAVRCAVPFGCHLVFFLKMYTKIIERHPLQIGRGILARATSVAALAPAPKPGRFLKKTMSKTLAFTAPKSAKNVSIYRARHHCGIPTKN